MDIVLEASITGHWSAKVNAGDVGCFTVQIRDGRYSFDVVDECNCVALKSSPWTESWWNSFLGYGEHRICDGDDVIAVVQHHGPFGFRRSAFLAGERGPFPRKHLFSLLGMDWSYKARRLRIENVEVGTAMAVIGLASYWLIRQIDFENM